MAHHEKALSDMVAQILIIFLVLVIALILIASVTGVLPKLLKKPAFLIVDGDQYDVSPTIHIISLSHKQGDPVNMKGTSQTGGKTLVYFNVTDKSGITYRVPNDGALHDDEWEAGQTMYLYLRGGNYVYSDVPPAAPGANLPADTYTVRIVDDEVQVLISTISVTIK
jgi:hypothetical protein